MPGWIMGVIVASVVVTGTLTWVLWRINADVRARGRHDGGEAGLLVGDAGRRDGSSESETSGDGGGGGDGGGD